jgi:hypothetical protein
MTDDQQLRASRQHRLPQRVDGRPIAWVPGEGLVSVNVDLAANPEPMALVLRLRQVLTAVLDDIKLTPRP